MPLSFPHEAISLIHELGEPIPPPLRTRFLERVSGLLSADEILAPAKIVEVCQRVQIELMIAPAADLEQPTSPSPQVPRSPYAGQDDH
jgi:hypothetical protein